MDYGASAEENVVAAVLSGNVENISGVHRDPSDSATPVLGGVFNLHALWAPGHGHVVDGKRSAHFVISEPPVKPVQEA